MGSLAAHIAGFLLLFPVGVRRLVSSYAIHLRSPSPSHYLPKPWYFFPTAAHNPHRRLSSLVGNLDLYFLLVALPIAASSELFLSLTIPRLPWTFSHNSASLALFWLLLLSLSLLNLPDDLAFLLSSLAFLADLFLTTPTAPSSLVESRVYGLIGVTTAACAGACLVMAARGRGAFAADVGLSAAMVLKGTWVLQAGVTLFGWPPRGCARGVAGGVLECELEEDRLRGVAVVDLLFVAHAVAVAAGCLATFAAVAWSVGRTTPAEAEMTRPMMMTMSDFESLD